MYRQDQSQSRDSHEERSSLHIEADFLPVLFLLGLLIRIISQRSPKPLFYLSRPLGPRYITPDLTHGFPYSQEIFDIGRVARVSGLGTGGRG